MSESRYKNTQAIILKKHFLGENDLSLTFFSPDLGKFQAISKSSRKILSTKGSHLDLLNLVTLQLYQKQDRFLVIQCQTINPFSKIKSEIDSSIIAQVMSEIILRSTDGTEDAASHFNLLKDSLESLSDSHNLLLTLEQFKIRLLDQLGLLPNLSHCPDCRDQWPVSESLHLHSEHFLICDNCAKKHPAGNLTAVPFAILKLLNYLAVTPFNGLKINLKNTELTQLQQLTRQLFHLHLHQEIKSERMLLGF